MPILRFLMKKIRKKQDKNGNKGLFFYNSYITMWLKVVQSGFLWWKNAVNLQLW